MNVTATEPSPTEAIRSLNDRYLLNTYGTRKISFGRGEGVTLWDVEGKDYLDFFAGIAVCNLGHCHPAVTKAIQEQAGKLVHVSNLYYIEPQARLAEKLSQHSFAGRWFFGNSGAEANEGGIKLARRYWAEQGAPKPHIVCAESSFHGRTLAAITATGQPKYRKGFDPMPPGFHHVPYGDIDALAAAITPEVGAVLLEPIQGEGGVRVAPEGYWPAVRRLCDDKDVLLILDEVQTGMGRTGTLFAYEGLGIAPDIILLAKALGNGVPIGAIGCTEKVAAGFPVGAHASTFGGNPLCCAAALATLEVLTQPDFLPRAAQVGQYFQRRLHSMAECHDCIADVRGKGLMIGVEFREPVMPLVELMVDAGVVCGPAGPNVLRFVPPLIIDTDHVEHVLSILETNLGALGWSAT